LGQWASPLLDATVLDQEFVLCGKHFLFDNMDNSNIGLTCLGNDGRSKYQKGVVHKFDCLDNLDNLDKVDGLEAPWAERDFSCKVSQMSECESFTVDTPGLLDGDFKGVLGYVNRILEHDSTEMLRLVRG
jgi:hypothetical protein